MALAFTTHIKIQILCLRLLTIFWYSYHKQRAQDNIPLKQKKTFWDKSIDYNEWNFLE